MDVRNFQASMLTAKYRNMLSELIQEESNLWPNSLHMMFIVNAPWPFRFSWSIISKFIDPITVKKIHILGADYVETMKQYIDLEQIPKEYGGSGDMVIQYGYMADIDPHILDVDWCKVPDFVDLHNVYNVKSRASKSILCDRRLNCVNVDDVKSDN